MDRLLDKVVDHNRCGAPVSDINVTDLVFADDTVLLMESLQVLVMTLLLGLKESCAKTRSNRLEA